MALRDIIDKLTGKARAAVVAAPAVIARGDRTMADALSGQSSKPIWPPPAEQPRRLRYARNCQVYEGYHHRALVRYVVDTKGAQVEIPAGERHAVPGEDFNFSIDRRKPYIAFNLSSRVVDVLAERAFSEGVSVGAPKDQQATQALLDAVGRDNNLQAKHLQACTAAGWRGDVVYEVFYDADEQRIGVELVDPSRCFAEAHPLNSRRLVAMNIDQVLPWGDAFYLWRKRHELRGGEGWVLNKLYRMDKDTAGLHVSFATDEVPLETHPTTALLAGQEEQATGVRGLLVVHVANREHAEGGIWGDSDFSYDLLGLQAELNNRVTQRGDVLNQHVTPWMYGPQIQDDRGNVQTANKYLAVEDASGGAPIGMLVWDAQLGAVAESVKDLRTAFATTAGVDLASLMPREAGGSTSGRALRIEQMNTQGSAQAKQQAFHGPLQRLYSVITQLAVQPYVQLAWQAPEGKPVALRPEDISIGFGDGLPSQSIDDVEEQEIRLRAGTQTRRDAIMVLDGVSAEDAEAKVALIDADKGRAALQAESGIARRLPAVGIASLQATSPPSGQ